MIGWYKRILLMCQNYSSNNMNTFCDVESCVNPVNLVARSLNFFWVIMIYSCSLLLAHLFHEWDLATNAPMGNSEERCTDLTKRIVDLSKSGKSFGTISIQRRSQEQLRKQVLVSIKCIGQFATIRKKTQCCCEKFGQDGQASNKNTQKHLCNELETGRCLQASTDTGLRGCCVRRKPLVQKQHLQAWLKFTSDHMDKDKTK